jgi:hypothetical protein
METSFGLTFAAATAERYPNRPAPFNGKKSINAETVRSKKEVVQCSVAIKARQHSHAASVSVLTAS